MQQRRLLLFLSALQAAGLTSRAGCIPYLLNGRSISGGFKPSPASLGYSLIVSFVYRKPYPRTRTVSVKMTVFHECRPNIKRNKRNDAVSTTNLLPVIC